MMAIEAAVASADTLEEARKEVADLTGSIGISLNDRELLSCDSKMIAGMLFGKIKQAEAANHHIELSLHGLFKKTVTPETEWIEVIGILLDSESIFTLLQLSRGAAHGVPCLCAVGLTLTNLRIHFILVTGESRISRLSGEVHTPVWPQAFMGPVGHYDHPCTQDAP